MYPTLDIRNEGRRIDGCYFSLLLAFWITWTLTTVWVTLEVTSNFNIDGMLWLVFAYLGVVGIPYLIGNSQKPQRLVATGDSLIVYGSGIPFKSRVRIPRDQPIELHFGHYAEGDVEAVATLNLVSGDSFWTRRIMISPLSHPDEKREIFREIRSFLKDQGFLLEVVEDDATPPAGSDRRGN